MKSISIKLLIFIFIALAGYFARLAYLNRSAVNTIIKLEYADDLETTKGHKPSLCVGSVEPGMWGSIHTDCPPHHAIYYSQDTSVDRNSPAQDIPLAAYCCRLPAEDILTNEHVYNVSGECPSNHVVTSGAGRNCGSNCSVRCTRINNDRYKLGPKYKATTGNARVPTLQLEEETLGKLSTMKFPRQFDMEREDKGRTLGTLTVASVLRLVACSCTNTIPAAVGTTIDRCFLRTEEA